MHTPFAATFVAVYVLIIIRRGFSKGVGGRAGRYPLPLYESLLPEDMVCFLLAVQTSIAIGTSSFRCAHATYKVVLIVPRTHSHACPAWRSAYNNWY